jgi:hypothetical protein
VGITAGSREVPGRKPVTRDTTTTHNNIIIIIIIITIIIHISKSFRKYVSTIPGNHEVKELQKTAILCTAHILRKVLI